MLSFVLIVRVRGTWIGVMCLGFCLLVKRTFLYGANRSSCSGNKILHSTLLSAGSYLSFDVAYEAALFNDFFDEKKSK